MDYTDILPLDESAMTAARGRVDSLSKPLGSLGQLEEYAVRLAGIRGFMGGTLSKRAVLVFAADNGIYKQGITPVPQEVTPMQTVNIANGIAGVNALAAQAGAEVFVYNVGVAQELKRKNIVDVLVMHGTNDMTQGPAMTRAQCEAAMKAGYEAAAAQASCDVIGLGEMGICNTSTTAAVASVLLGKSVAEMTGRGAGITDGQYRKKVAAIERAIAVNGPDAENPVDRQSGRSRYCGHDGRIPRLCALQDPGRDRRIYFRLRGAVRNAHRPCERILHVCVAQKRRTGICGDFRSPRPFARAYARDAPRRRKRLSADVLYSGSVPAYAGRYGNFCGRQYRFLRIYRSKEIGVP